MEKPKYIISLVYKSLFFCFLMNALNSPLYPFRSLSFLLHYILKDAPGMFLISLIILDGLKFLLFLIAIFFNVRSLAKQITLVQSNSKSSRIYIFIVLLVSKNY